jgi:acyl-CoA thioesterase FadM
MYRLRFIFVMISSFLSKKKELSADFTLKFTAIPFLDTDVFYLFTQTYGQYMGLARWNLLFNSEFRTAALKKGWVPVTTKETISYKRPIKAFERITLVTRIVHWNDRRFYIEHLFYVKGEIRSITYVEGLVRGPKGHLQPNEAFKEMGVIRESPQLPINMQGWLALQYEPHTI